MENIICYLYFFFFIPNSPSISQCRCLWFFSYESLSQSMDIFAVILAKSFNQVMNTWFCLFHTFRLTCWEKPPWCFQGKNPTLDLRCVARRPKGQGGRGPLQEQEKRCLNVIFWLADGLLGKEFASVCSYLFAHPVIQLQVIQYPFWGISGFSGYILLLGRKYKTKELCYLMILNLSDQLTESQGLFGDYYVCEEATGILKCAAVLVLKLNLHRIVCKAHILLWPLPTSLSSLSLLIIYLDSDQQNCNGFFLRLIMFGKMQTKCLGCFLDSGQYLVILKKVHIFFLFWVKRCLIYRTAKY